MRRVKIVPAPRRRNLARDARLLRDMLTPLARAIDSFFGWGEAAQKGERLQAQTQLTNTRIMRELSREERDRAMFDAKLGLLQAQIEHMEQTNEKLRLENERLRKELGKNAPPFRPES